MTKAQKIVGACVRAFRERAGWSQEALAQKVGISYQYLSEIEAGKRNFTVQVLEQMAQAL